jgi:2-polyprenyl-6-hydroxyphenyl methylase/3-demethylubiquinone-9 3-methyltransferase
MALVCKCCGERTAHLGDVDFNKSCMDRFGQRAFPPSEVMVPYYSCGRCGFIFTDFMDQWSRADFLEKVYNDDYRIADPPLLVAGGASPPKDTIAYHNGLMLASRLRGAEREIRILDFGAGGNPGLTGSALIDSGFQLDSYEPNFVEGGPEPTGVYDVIVMIEVIEHCHDLQEVMTKISSWLSDYGFVYISTALHPAKHDKDILGSWYIAPRNGHISIFTLPAISILFRRYGINLVQTMFGLLAFRQKPRFRSDFFV